MLASNEYVELQHDFSIRVVKDIRAMFLNAHLNLDLKLLAKDCGEVNPKPSDTKSTNVANNDDVTQDIKKESTPPLLNQVHHSTPPSNQG